MSLFNLRKPICAIAMLLVIAAILLSLKEGRQNRNQTFVVSQMPGWIKLLSNPETFDGKCVRVRGVLTHKDGAGTGVEIWIAKWAISQGQLEFCIHIQEESAYAFWGGNHTSKLDDLEGKVVEVTGKFVAHSNEGSSGDLVAIGDVSRIMICDLDSPAKAGVSLIRPESE